MTPRAATLPRSGAGLWRWSVFAAMLAAAGLPIYIHAPKVFAETHGISLAAMGVVLAALRLVDLVQDPALGWLAERTAAQRPVMVAGAGGIMAAAMLGLFAVAPPIAPLLWFALMLAALFSGWSFLTIVFYATGVARGQALGPGGHLRLAGWREGGSLVGVSGAAVAPLSLAALGLPAFPAFAAGFAGLALLSLIVMGGQWHQQATIPPAAGAFRRLLASRDLRGLLLLALVNAAPVAVTSTLFLFFVETTLQAPGREGPLLLLFFLSAAISAPGWSLLATRIGARRALLAGMVLAIAAFGFTLTLGAGDLAAFALICVASGAAMGADLVLLPAIFARSLARHGEGEAAGFALWGFASKAVLSLAALVALPLLGLLGLQAGSPAPQAAALALSLLYGALPCVLKCLAIALLLRLDSEGFADE